MAPSETVQVVGSSVLSAKREQVSQEDWAPATAFTHDLQALHDAQDQPTDTGPLPSQLISRYINVAMRRALLEWLPEDGTWYAEITILPGVWAQGATEADVLKELRSVLEGWVYLKIEDRDRDFPVLDSIKLNVI